MIFIGLVFCAPAKDNPDDRLKKILTADNTALTEIAGWIEENKQALRSSASEREFFAIRIRQRLNQVHQQYQDFLKDHPNHTQARIAYGSFLTHIDNRKEALGQWKKALATDPGNAAALNNIATHIGTVAIQSSLHTQIPEAFQSLEKAIALAPNEALYRHNYATTLCAFRLEAVLHYKITAREVTHRALKELVVGMKLAPENFEIAADRAETFHDLKPLPRQRALQAWEESRKRAKGQQQLDWVNLQVAIVHLETGHYDAAEKSLKRVSKKSHVNLIRKLRAALAHKRKENNPKP
jgi:tetratricopeptide (TPR) repeat protein